MPVRKRADQRSREKLCPDTIDRMRQSYVAQIARARKFSSAPTALLDKATSLLTAHWGRANWNSRAAILKTVDWLLQIAILHPAPPPRSRTSQRALHADSARV